MKLILASSSPRRRELLALLGLTPDQIISPEVNETPLKNEVPRDYVQRVAIEKARAVHFRVPEAYILAADTIVERGRKIVLKAENEAEARRILESLSGRRHRVYTTVCVISPDGKEACRTVLTRLSFKRLSGEDLEAYLHSKEWEGKAGAYGIQGMAAKFVTYLSGSYTNVIGLPLYETECLLNGLGFRF
jgi:septum formation protein